MRKFASLTALAVIGSIIATFPPANAAEFELTSNKGTIIQASEITSFNEPWAMTFLPDGTMLVTTKPGKLYHVTQTGRKIEVKGMWKVAYGGQGGFGDVVLHPDYAKNGYVYISNAETLDGGRTIGAIVTRAKLDCPRSGSNLRLPDEKAALQSETMTSSSPPEK